MEIEVLGADRIRFDDGIPVRAESAVARLGDGHLVVSDDATHAAWRRGDSVTPVRLIAPVEGHEVFDEVFDEASGTKHLKPDFEAATNPRDDAPVVASALARLRDDDVAEVVALPRLDGRVIKVEGLTVLDVHERRTTLLAVTDMDDPDAPSWAVRLLVRR